MGSYDASAGTLGQTSPSIMGVSSNSFLWGDYHYISMWEKCFGRSFGMSSGDDKAAIMDTEEYQNMPVYPAWDCVAVINDTIVVKLSE
jgi:hypothetical protein